MGVRCSSSCRPAAKCALAAEGSFAQAGRGEAVCACIGESVSSGPTTSSAIYSASFALHEPPPVAAGLSTLPYRIVSPVPGVTPFLAEYLLAQLFEHALCHSVLGVPGEPLLQNLSGLRFLSLRHVKSRQVQVGLIKIGRRPNSFLELFLGLCVRPWRTKSTPRLLSASG